MRNQMQQGFQWNWDWEVPMELIISKNQDLVLTEFTLSAFSKEQQSHPLGGKHFYPSHFSIASTYLQSLR